MGFRVSGRRIFGYLTLGVVVLVARHSRSSSTGYLDPGRV